MLRVISRLWTRAKDKGQSSGRTGVDSKWESVFSRLRDIENGLSEMHTSLSNVQDELSEATGLLEDGKEEYLGMYRSRLGLLRQLAERLIRCEHQGYQRIARDLEEILLEEGVERFEPRPGDPVIAGKCVVDAKLETGFFPPGSVAICRTPGFNTADGEAVILEAHVYRSVLPPEAERDKIILSELPDPESSESRKVSHFLLSEAHTPVEKQKITK